MLRYEDEHDMVPAQEPAPLSSEPDGKILTRGHGQRYKGTDERRTRGGQGHLRMRRRAIGLYRAVRFGKRWWVTVGSLPSGASSPVGNFLWLPWPQSLLALLCNLWPFTPLQASLHPPPLSSVPSMWSFPWVCPRPSSLSLCNSLSRSPASVSFCCICSSR